MNSALIVIAIGVASLLSLLFSTLTYALRDFSRARLSELLEARGKEAYLEPTVENASDLIFITAVGRLLANILVFIGVLLLLHDTGLDIRIDYLIAAVVTAAIHVVFSVAFPQAIALHAAEPAIAVCVRLLHGMRLATLPIIKLMHATDAVVAKAATTARNASEPDKIEQEIERDILSAVEEGEKEGVVDEDERRMIESVIAFHNTQVGQIMTPRPQIFALEVGATLEHIKAKIAESGHSRIPVYSGRIDHIVGVLYARDLLPFLGSTPDQFDIHRYIRPGIFVPETKPLGDLLKDFRLQKVHMAIVNDEYGGTAGLVTIEDIFEELVGDISDEHEPSEPAMLTRIDDLTAEADARVEIDELNRILGLDIPEDEGYDTLGGFITTQLGRIPAKGFRFDYGQVKYTILDAEPQKVNRVRIELKPVKMDETSTQTTHSAT